MKKDTKTLVSESLETTPEFLQYLPELVADLWELGSSPELYIDMLRSLQLPFEEMAALDLGCGKGAVSIALAKEFGMKVVGVDACAPFVNEAKKKAKQHQVQNLCQFYFADIRDFIETAADYDLVIYASLGNVLGRFAECVRKLRFTVKVGGYILIDDGFLKKADSTSKKGYEHYASHVKTIKQLTSCGDFLVKEEILPDQINRDINNYYLHAIKQRSITMIEKMPELEHQISNYIKNQEIECEFIDQYTSGAIWILQRMS
jgi:2-polyprenyl-3-methyl-5-hydroxy-6-metoxy-1,4-benzoquinol methylase